MKTFASLHLVIVGLALFTVNWVTCSVLKNLHPTYPANVQLVAFGGVGEGWLADVDLISLSNNGHKTAPPMPYASDSFGSLVLNNTLYVLGGFGSSTDGSKFISLDLKAGQDWVQLTDFPDRIFGPKLLAAHGAIYSFGGDGRKYGNMNYTYKYDFETKVWSEIPTLLPPTNAFFCAVADEQSNFYLIADTGFMYRSTDGAQSWEMMNSLKRKWQFTSCAAVRGGLIVQAGCFNGDAADNNVTDEANVYNISSNTWKSAATMSKPRADAEAIAIPESDDVVVCGGYYRHQSNGGGPFKLYYDCDVYNTIENKWKLAEFSLNKKRTDFGFGVVRL